MGYLDTEVLLGSAQQESEKTPGRASPLINHIGDDAQMAS